LVRDASHPTCLFALYKDAFQTAKSLCKFHVIPSDSMSQDLYVLDYPQILLRNAPLIQVSCPQPISFPTSCTFCFYTIPCACSVTTPLTYLPPRISQCNSSVPHPLKSVPQYPVNLALLHHFFDNDSLSAFDGETLLPLPLPLQLPPMKFFNHSFDQKLAIDHSLSYQLDKVVNASKADAHIYRSIIDPILAGDLLVPSNFFLSTPGYITSATAVVASLNLCFSCWLIYKLRITSAALTALLAHAPPVRAKILPTSLVASLPPTSPLPSFTSLTYFLPPDFYTYVFLVLICVFIGHRIYRYCVPRFGSSPTFDIYLEIKVNTECVFLKIQSVTGCPSDYLVTGSGLCSNLRLDGWLRPRLCFHWSDLTMTHASTNCSLRLPSSVPISLFWRCKLASLLANDYVCLLFFQHADHAFYVSL
jgi:hypothetical protein